MKRQRPRVDSTVVSLVRRGGGSGEPAPPPVPPASGLEQPWLLDSRAVALLLGISRTKAFQLMSTGVIPVVRIGRCVRVSRSGLGRWIEAQSSAALPDTVASS